MALSYLTAYCILQYKASGLMKNRNPNQRQQAMQAQKPKALIELLVLALLLATAGCTSSRFMPPSAAPGMAPTGASKPSTGGPYTREREDREFGQPNNEP
jgi:hypothetical protein